MTTMAEALLKAGMINDQQAEEAKKASRAKYERESAKTRDRPPVVTNAPPAPGKN